MAATPSVKVIKSLGYRGGVHLFSNRYHFNGGVPADNTAWNALFDAIVLLEKAIYMNNVTIVQAVAYLAGSEVPVHSKDYTLVGTGAFASFQGCPGQDAALVRYATTARSAKNHPIYLFNYVHGVGNPGGGNNDTLNAAQKTAIESYATAWLAGFSDGTNTLVRAGPNGATATSRLVNGFITHRDFPA